LPEVDHLSHTHSIEHAAFSRGQPQWGAHLADELTTLLQIHDPSTVAAVIVEPVIGSGGVLPPPVGYLEQLRAICDRHGILLIFDEVITGFGRLGAAFGAEAFGVTPDLITCAKGMTNGAVPMGGVIASRSVYDALMAGPSSVIELFHGYTYSAHPLACAAALATLDVYRDLELFARCRRLAPIWEQDSPRPQRRAACRRYPQYRSCWRRLTLHPETVPRGRAPRNAPSVASTMVFSFAAAATRWFSRRR
jgi:beta-alanine--pyruvate transaminase